MQDIWFCEFTEQNIGISRVKLYSKPEKRRFSLSATSGNVYSWSAGLQLSYDRFITCYDRDFNPREGTMVFVDVVPVLDEDGNLATKEDHGIQVPITEPDYMIKKIFKKQKGKVFRFGLEKM